jgi:hypothetical protein
MSVERRDILAPIATHQVVSSQAFFRLGSRGPTARLTFVLAFVFCFVAGSSVAFAQEEPLPPASEAAEPAAPVAESSSRPGESFHEFVADTFLSPYPYAYAVAGATLDQVARFPTEWGHGSAGFSKRTAARIAQGFVADSVAHGTAAFAHQRIDYDPCSCTGTVARAKHAMSRAFVAVRNDGRPAPNWPLWVSKYSAAGLAHAWYPESYTRRDAIVQATSAVAISAGLNVLREFAHFK